MRYFNDVAILNSGIRVPAHLLYPLGIGKGSLCWCVTLPDPLGRSTANDHFLISPIHPSAWPFLFQITLTLRREPGILLSIAEILAKEESNILFAHQGPGGYTHGAWIVVAEAVRVRDTMKQQPDWASFDPQNNGKPLDRGLPLRNQLAAEMMIFLASLKDELEKAHEARLPAWTRASRTLKQKRERSLRSLLKSRHGLFDARTYARRSIVYEEKDVRRFIKSRPSREGSASVDDILDPHDTVRAIKSNWLDFLTYAYFASDRSHTPLQLRFNYHQNLLEPTQDSDGDYADFFSRVERPGRAIATFDTVEHHMRLKVKGPEEAKRTILLSINYQASRSDEARLSKPASPTDAHSSLGLLRTILGPIKEHGFSLDRVENRLRELSPSGREHGDITIVAEHIENPQQPRAPFEERVAKLKRDLQNSRAGAKLQVQSRPFDRRRLFLSIRLDGLGARPGKSTEIRELIKEEAWAIGWSIDYVDTLTDDPRPQVLDRIAACDVALIVALLRPGERLNDQDFAWLHFEHGIIASQRLHYAILVEVGGQITFQDWKGKFTEATGLPLAELDTSHTVERQRQVRAVLEELASKLARSSERYI